MIVLCDRETCVHCEWTKTYGNQCSRGSFVHLEDGKCIDYEKEVKTYGSVM